MYPPGILFSLVYGHRYFWEKLREDLVYSCGLKGFRSMNGLKCANCMRGHELPLQWAKLGFCLVDQVFFFSAYICQAPCLYASCFSFSDFHDQFTITTDPSRWTLWLPFCPWVLYKLPLLYHWLVNDTTLPLALQDAIIPTENGRRNSMIASPTSSITYKKTDTTELFEVDGALPHQCFL